MYVICLLDGLLEKVLLPAHLLIELGDFYIGKGQMTDLCLNYHPLVRASKSLKRLFLGGEFVLQTTFGQIGKSLQVCPL